MSLRPDLSVGQRLGMGFGMVALVVLLLATVAVVTGLGVRALVSRQVELIEPRVEAADALERAILDKAIAVRAYVVTRDAPELEALGHVREDLAQRLRRLESVPQDADGRRLLDDVVSLDAAWTRTVDVLLDLLRRGGVAGSPAMIDAETAMSRAREPLLEAVRRYHEHELAQARELRNEVRAAVEPLAVMLPAAALLVILVSGLTIGLVSRSIREPAGRIVAAARALSAGDYGAALALAPAAPGPDGGEPGLRDELRELARGFSRMAELLRQREERLAARARVAAALATSLEPGRLAAAVLGEVAEHLGGEVGVVYAVPAGGDALQPLATRALNGHLTALRVGDGVPGQAAADRRTYVVRDIPDDTPFQIRLGVNQAPPRWIAASPMMTGDRVVGVLVVGGLGTLADDGVAFLEDAVGRLAVSVDNAQAHAALERITVELHQKNELLQVQNEELQAQGEELQTQAEELQTQTEQLQEHRDELERHNETLALAEQRKNEFLAMLGHELRNPQGAIGTATGLLRSNGAQGGEHTRAVAVITRQTRHLTRLVDDLLDVSRVTHGAILLSTRPLDLGEVVARTVETVGGALGDRGRRVVVNTESVWVDGDETRIEQITSNLVTNALKYTPAGGRVVVSVVRQDGTAVLRVEDDGIGISADLLPHVFDLFVQQPRSRDRARGGLGIGLTLVRHLVELHGGAVEATSGGAGKGATFTVRLRAIPPPPSSTPGAAAPAVARATCSLVVAEDNTDAREMLQVLLSRAGHDVHEADSGPTAVERIVSVRPEVALIDLDLPDFDGYEVTRRVRARPELAGTRLVALTGYGQTRDRQRALEAGFDEHLVKPIDPDHLLQAIDAIRTRKHRPHAGFRLDAASDHV